MGKRNPPRLRIERAAIAAGSVSVTGDELHHLRVRRVDPGDEVLCFDDSGDEWRGTVRRISARAAEIELATADSPARESPLHLVLAQAALKGDHLDLVVEKATEIGVAEIVLLTSERTIARPSAARVERLRRIAESAAKQSGRVHLPAIVGPLELDQVLSPTAIFFQPGAPPLARTAPTRRSLTAIVGPEGGFSDAEAARAAKAGCTLAGLGPRTLRAETAAIAVAALCQSLWGDWLG